MLAPRRVGARTNVVIGCCGQQGCSGGTRSTNHELPERHEFQAEPDGAVGRAMITFCSAQYQV